MQVYVGGQRTEIILDESQDVLKQRAASLFQEVSCNGSKDVTCERFLAWLGKLGVQGDDEDEVQQLFFHFDCDHNGVLDVDEMIELVKFLVAFDRLVTADLTLRWVSPVTPTRLRIEGRLEPEPASTNLQVDMTIKTYRTPKFSLTFFLGIVYSQKTFCIIEYFQVVGSAHTHMIRWVRRDINSTALSVLTRFDWSHFEQTHVEDVSTKDSRGGFRGMFFKHLTDLQGESYTYRVLFFVKQEVTSPSARQVGRVTSGVLTPSRLQPKLQQI